MRDPKLITRTVSSIAKQLRGESFKIDPAVPASYLFGFGWSKLRARLLGIIRLRRLRPAVFIDPGAKINCLSKVEFRGFANLKSGSFIDAVSHEGVVLGRGFSLGRGASIECTGSLKKLGKGFVSGDNVGVGSGSFFGCAGGISVGENTIFGNFVSMHSENHNFDRTDIPIRLQGVSHKGIQVGRDCWIGAKATILDGAVIGDHSVVAGGALVLEGQYPSGSLLAGVPARVVKKIR